MEVVIRIIKCLKFRLAAVAGASIHMTDMQTATEAFLNILRQLPGRLRSQRLRPDKVLSISYTKGPVV
jgi:hypothetical protein